MTQSELFGILVQVKLPDYVKPMPWPLGYVYSGLALGDVILIRKKILKDLKSKNPDPKNVGTLLHELEHKKRINRTGYLKFFIKYLCSSKFRLKEELVAIKVSMKYLKKHNLSFDIEKRARHLSGPIYLFCTSYKNAKRELQKLWEEV